MSQINLKKQTNASTATPLTDYLGLFYSTTINAWAYKDDTGAVQKFVAEILTGSGAPSSGLGKDGDFYLDTVSADYYTKAAGTWTLQGTLTGGGGGVSDHTLLTNIGTNTHAQIDTHIADTSNPHSVTKAQVGLSNVDNTSDINKPVSTAQATAIGLKEDSSNKTTNFTGNTGSNTLFPTVKAIYDALVGYLANYEPLLGFIPAKQDLSNLTPTAINKPLVPDGDVTYDIGTLDNRWYSGYFQFLRTYLDNIRFDIDLGLLLADDESKSIDINNRVLFDENEKTSIEFSRRRFYDSSEKISGDYDVRQLIDNTGQASVSWNGRQLLDSGGNSAVDWQARQLTDDGELLVLDFIDRRLVASDGSTIVADFSNPTGVTTITQSPSDNSTKLATTAYVDAASKPIDIQKFTSSGTWTKPAGAKRVLVALRGGAGGGGSGRRGAAATNRFGGGSGVVPSIVWMWFDANDLAATETVTVGAGGTGGAAVTTNDTNGNAGTTGGISSFGTTVKLKTPTSAAGTGGTGAAGSGGTSQTTLFGMFNTVQLGGVNGATGAGTTGGARTDFATTQSGGGGGIAAANGPALGGVGGQLTVNSVAPTTNGGAAGSTSGGDGGDTNFTGTYFLGIPIGTGAGGGGSAGSASLPGGSGGNGFTSGGIHTGAAGGGGAASLNGFASGKGGDGSNGIVVVITEF